MMVKEPVFMCDFKMSRENAEKEVFTNGLKHNLDELRYRTLTVEEIESGRTYINIPDFKYSVRCTTHLVNEDVVGFGMEISELPTKWMDALAEKGIAFEAIYEQYGGPYCVAECDGVSKNIHTRIFEDFSDRRNYLINKEDLFKSDVEKDM